MWIRTARHHLNLDKVEYTELLPNGSIRLFFQDSFIVLKDEEAKQVLEYLDSIAAPTWALEVPEVMKEYES